MATRKPKVVIPVDEKLTNQDVDLFDILKAIDNKDYEYYGRLSPEQQKKVAMFILVSWTSAVKGSGDLQRYYLSSTEYHANKYFLNEHVSKHPRLQWMMLCAAAPGMGKQFHQWIPQISNKVATLAENANVADMKKYYTKLYPRASAADITEISQAFVTDQKRKCHLAKVYPNMKLADIEMLNSVITDDDIKQYEQDRGN